MSKEKLNILIQLATIDRNFASKERKLIDVVAKANGVSESEVEQMLNNPEPIPHLDALTEDERFEYLYLVIQLMKIDGQVFKSEIVFCEDIAQKLGFKRKVVSELSKNIYSDPSITADRDMLRHRATKLRAV
jgi:uncharacterized membrane protein YebE (DUF533 family)